MPLKIPSDLTIDKTVEWLLTLTHEESREFYDMASWGKLFWTLPSKQGVVPFKLTVAQEYVMREYRRQWKERGYVRLNILKCRQAGITTLFTRMALQNTILRPAIGAMTLAHDKDMPETWLLQCRDNLDETPALWKRETIKKRGSQLAFDNKSRYQIGSVQGGFPGMGTTYHFLHCSEVGKWDKPPIGKNPDDVLGPLLPTIPSGAFIQGTTVVYESTGVMVGDWWYRKWDAGRREEDDFVNLFIPWFMCFEYTIEGKSVELTEYELFMREEATRYGIELTDGQIAWYRHAIAQPPFFGNEEMFRAEFPTTEQEAFMSAGGLQYTCNMIDNAKKTIRNPIRRQKVMTDGNPKQAQFFDNPNGYIEIFEEPVRGAEYVIGADCQWGETDGADFDVLYVEDLDTKLMVAKVKGQFEQIHWADIIAAMGYKYNNAWVAPERNNQSANGVMPRLLGLHDSQQKYPKVWRWRKAKQRSTKDYGWYTDHKSKGDLITFTQGRSLQEEIDWCDKEAVDQMSTIIMHTNNKIGAPKGMKDDCWMARSITAYVSYKLRKKSKKVLDKGQSIAVWSPAWYDLQAAKQSQDINRTQKGDEYGY